jgi:hypothetical protein
MIRKVVAATILALQMGVTPAGAQGSKVEIDLPESIRHKGAPIFAEVEQAAPKKVEGWSFRHVFLRVRLSDGRFEYLTYIHDPASRRRWFALAGPDKKGVKPLIFMIAKEPGINETALPKLTIKNNASAFENLKLEMSGIKVSPWYDGTHGPFIYGCINLCDPDQARAGLASYYSPASPPIVDASPHAPKPEAAPQAPKPSENEQIHVYAYDPDKGIKIDGPHVIVLPSCDMTKLKTSPPTPIKASGHVFTLPADAKVRSFCLLISEHPDPKTYRDYRCDLRPRADPGHVTQAWIAWGPSGRTATSFLPYCTAPPPRTLSVKVYDIPIDSSLESAREQISRGELKSWPPAPNLGAFSISNAKPKVDGASLRWDAPYGQEVGKDISVTPPNDNYEFVGTNFENDDLAVFLRRRAVSFGEVSFRLTDEAGKPEPNCDAVLLVPRKAVSAGKHRPPVKDEVPLYVGADGNYFPSLDLTSARQRTSDARLLLAALDKEITIETRSDNCRLQGDAFRRPVAQSDLPSLRPSRC